MIMFMPAKYQPDHMYLRHVRINRVHLFTFFQILCLGILWVIKAIKTISIVFPVMVLGTCFVRKGMEKIFTSNELKWLDDMDTEDKMMKQEDAGVLIVEDDDIDDVSLFVFISLVSICYTFLLVLFLILKIFSLYENLLLS